MQLKAKRAKKGWKVAVTARGEGSAVVTLRCRPTKRGPRQDRASRGDAAAAHAARDGPLRDQAARRRQAARDPHLDRLRNHRGVARHADTPSGEPPSIAESIGGPLGMAEAALPAVAFVTAYSISGQDTAPVRRGGRRPCARAHRRPADPARVAAPRDSGLVGVAFAAFIATRSGRAEDFFLPGLLANAAYAARVPRLDRAAAGRWSAASSGQLDRRGDGLARRPACAWPYIRATWLWALLFSARLAVQLPLYLAGAVVALGVARTAMGVPLFALGAWLTWRLVRQRQEPAEAQEPGTA